MIKFEVGKFYRTQPVNRMTPFRVYKVVRRTEKTVWLQNVRTDTLFQKRIVVLQNVEYVNHSSPEPLAATDERKFS